MTHIAEQDHGDDLPNLYADLLELASAGLIEQDGDGWALTEAGFEVLRKLELEDDD